MDWEVLITTRKLLKSSEHYKIGAILGHLEFSQNQVRQNQVKALTNCKLYILPWNAYKTCFFYIRSNKIDFNEEERVSLEKRFTLAKIEPEYCEKIYKTEIQTKKKVFFSH